MPGIHPVSQTPVHPGSSPTVTTAAPQKSVFNFLGLDGIGSGAMKEPDPLMAAPKTPRIGDRVGSAINVISNRFDMAAYLRKILNLDEQKIERVIRAVEKGADSLPQSATKLADSFDMQMQKFHRDFDVHKKQIVADIKDTAEKTVTALGKSVHASSIEIGTKLKKQAKSAMIKGSLIGAGVIVLLSAIIVLINKLISSPFDQSNLENGIMAAAGQGAFVPPPQPNHVLLSTAPPAGR